jgi:hypothetical protein
MTALLFAGTAPAKTCRHGAMLRRRLREALSRRNRGNRRNDGGKHVLLTIAEVIGPTMALHAAAPRRLDQQIALNNG